MNMEYVFMLITIFPAKQKTSAHARETGRWLHTHTGPDLAKLNDTGRWEGIFLLYTSQSWTKVEVSCETFCPDFFSQQLFLPPLHTQRSSGRQDSTWIDHPHPKIWCFPLWWRVLRCDGWLSIRRGGWLGFTQREGWAKTGRRIWSLVMGSQIKCHCIEIAIRPPETLNSSEKKKEKHHINKSSVTSV